MNRTEKQTNVDALTAKLAEARAIYVTDYLGDYTVYGHRITAPWTEYGVTWFNFGGAYDGAVAGSFVADGTGWRTMDLTASPCPRGGASRTSGSGGS